MSDVRTKGSTRDAFIETTGQLLRRQGYAGSGLNEIVARSGAPKGSLYFHFPGGKEQLALAAMQRTGEQLREAVAGILASSEDPAEAIARLIGVLGEGLERSGYSDGCPIATVTLEAAAGSESIRTVAAATFDSWLDVLAQRLAKTGMPAPAATQRALLVLSAIEGALVLARARQDLAPLVAVREELRTLSY
jgi:AcrR family transcriptional regulator